MAIKSKYYVDIQSHKEETYVFDFEIDQSFFAQRADSLLENASVKVRLNVKKTSTMLEAKFQLDGWIELECDRSLSLFQEQISATEQIVFKFGEAYKELSEDVIVIPRETQGIDLDPFIYDFICLQIPMKKLHPDYRSEDSEEDELKVIFSTKQTDDDEKNTKEALDPRWAKLQMLNQK